VCTKCDFKLVQVWALLEVMLHRDSGEPASDGDKGYAGEYGAARE
jgi:hypothetical protein